MVPGEILGDHPHRPGLAADGQACGSADSSNGLAPRKPFAAADVAATLRNSLRDSEYMDTS